ncbi:MAG: LEA type 2 family protein [Gammaproteobacteria bacterium]|nr:LEA type 2 family protein [Gammaproteobacteria bacterium]
MNRTLIFRSICALFVLTLSGCATLYQSVEPPTVQLLSVSTPGVGADMSLPLTAQIRIDNPNSISLPVRGGALRLAINDTVIGDATIDNNFSIAAGESTVINLPATLNLRGALNAGLAALSIGSTQVDYRLDGHIDLGMRYLGRIRIDESGQVALGRNGR